MRPIISSGSTQQLCASPHYLFFGPEKPRKFFSRRTSTVRRMASRYRVLLRCGLPGSLSLEQARPRLAHCRPTVRPSPRARLFPPDCPGPGLLTWPEGYPSRSRPRLEGGEEPGPEDAEKGGYSPIPRRDARAGVMAQRPERPPVTGRISGLSCGSESRSVHTGDHSSDERSAVAVREEREGAAAGKEPATMPRASSYPG